MSYNASVEGSGTVVTCSMFATDPDMLANTSVRSMSSSETIHVPGPLPKAVVGRSLLERGFLPGDSSNTKLSFKFGANMPVIENRSLPVVPGGFVGSRGGVLSTTMRTGKLLSEVKKSPALERKLNVMLVCPGPD